jgi:hypothetical protein
VTLTKQNQGGRESGDDSGIATLLHDRVDHWDSETSKNGWERAHADVGDVVDSIAIANALEEERAVETDKPTSKTEQHLGERRVDIKVVLVGEVVRSKLSKVDLIEAVGK